MPDELGRAAGAAAGAAALTSSGADPAAAAEVSAATAAAAVAAFAGAGASTLGAPGPGTTTTALGPVAVLTPDEAPPANVAGDVGTSATDRLVAVFAGAWTWNQGRLPAVSTDWPRWRSRPVVSVTSDRLEPPHPSSPGLIGAALDLGLATRASGAENQGAGVGSEGSLSERFSCAATAVAGRVSQGCAAAAMEASRPPWWASHCTAPRSPRLALAPSESRRPPRAVAASLSMCAVRLPVWEREICAASSAICSLRLRFSPSSSSLFRSRSSSCCRTSAVMPPPATSERRYSTSACVCFSSVFGSMTSVTRAFIFTRFARSAKRRVQSVCTW
mmetsp:Transcript_10186/g.22407  ORF Transcript_10186/g.22407 Transcript_10186/m.22407 type:complete len:332 (+) Transcript_10186:298-1293(+)